MTLEPAVRGLAGVALALAGVLAPAAAAGGAPITATQTASGETAPTAAATTAAEQHCAIGIDAVEAADLAGESAPEPVCFSSLAEVVDYLTGQTTDDGSRFTASAAAASVAVGRVYTGINKGGSSLTFWGTSGCAGVTFGFPTLSSGWNTSISSVTGLNGCWATTYTATSYGGSRLNCTPYCSSLGSSNDRVKSLVFRPTGTLG
ncbi:hypothetical protein MUN74_13105 [Agromyces endophyticus]|uniref:hypothetical protein n=1 Tax=Agromyces sp. H17E-10 TaxID=2932244 RepID=UPI001FD12BE0|nr:hypothetical protein [Agromyces sp. H17E-10]UOQ88218.1 hypothetical protein MUN74_13105 [Agromyces sp. H17E-10]